LKAPPRWSISGFSQIPSPRKAAGSSGVLTAIPSSVRAAASMSAALTRAVAVAVTAEN
jgi:hypothetical protein